MSDSDKDFIQQILAHPKFPERPGVKIGQDDKGKPIWRFFIAPEEFYVDEIGVSWHDMPVRAVCGNFVGHGENNDMMRIYFFLDRPTIPDFTPNLIMGSQFIEK